VKRVKENKKLEQFKAKGMEAAKAGKPMSSISEEAGLYDIVARSGWLVGWELGGGDVTRGIVLTQRQRLEERREKALQNLKQIDDQIAALDAQETQ